MTARRKMHFLSRFYLAGFSPAGTERSLLHVRSKKLGRQWRSRAGTVGHQRDLFGPEGPDFPDNEFEDAFAAIESEVAPVLRKVLKEERLPLRPDLDLLIHIVALNSARPPAAIAQFEDHLDVLLRKILIRAINPEVHQSLPEDWETQGRDTTHIEDREDLIRRIGVGRVKGKLLRDPSLVYGVLGWASILVDLLGQRLWTLLRAPDDLHFICSDRPVSLLYNVSLPASTQARYDDPRFDVIMPLSRRCCLVGHFNRAPGTATASPHTVSFINLITETGAEDFIYSSTASYVVSPGPGSGDGNANRRDLRSAR